MLGNKFQVPKFMRPTVYGAMAVVMSIGLAACGADATATTAPAPTVAATVAPTLAATTAPAAEPTMAATMAPTAEATMDMSGNATATMPLMDMTATTAPAAEATTTTAPAAEATATTGTTASSAAEVDATLREWGLDLNTTTVSAGTIHFVVKNTGTMGHNLTIKDSSGNVLGKTANFSPSQSPVTLDVTLPAGTYTVYCSLPGHAQRGQTNTLVVQ